MARVLVLDDAGNVRASFSDRSGDPRRDDFEAPLPEELEALEKAWPDLVEAITAARDDRRVEEP